MTLNELDVRDQRLFRLMQQINFGRLESLEIKNGFAVCTPNSRRITSKKIGGENVIHISKRSDGNFLLSDKHLSFLKSIKELTSAVIEVIQIQNGLPVSMEISEAMDQF